MRFRERECFTKHRLQVIGADGEDLKPLRKRAGSLPSRQQAAMKTSGVVFMAANLLATLDELGLLKDQSSALEVRKVNPRHSPPRVSSFLDC